MPLVTHDDESMLEPGEWLFDAEGLSARLPNGELWMANHPNGITWNVTGPPEAPTVTPSINCPPSEGRSAPWHGFLTAGEWKTC